MAEPGDRRPIAARERAVTQRVAGWLVRRGASADGISLAGMVAGLLAGLSRAAVAWTRLDAPVWLPGALAKAGRLRLTIGPPIATEGLDREAITAAAIRTP